jgi:phosphatidate cytidylyltransferase
MLKTRVISALVGIVVVIIGVQMGGLIFAVGAAIIAMIAGWEFVRMMRAGGYSPSLAVPLALIPLLVLDSYYGSLRLLSLIMSIGLLGALALQLFRHSKTPTADWALGIAGGLYLGWGMGHIVALRELADGLYLIWLTLLCTWASDTFAYFAGRSFGGRLVERKLWPRHSPKKTWEGLFGGVAGSLVVAALFVTFTPLSWGGTMLAGAIIPIAGLFGDLGISLMKRDVGVKDSSNLFPGHGGFLDRIDSVLFIAVVVYYLIVWLG